MAVLPTMNTPIARCEEKSLHTQAMLSRFADVPALNGLGTLLATATNTLLARQAELQQKTKTLILLRVEVTWCDRSADQLVRAGIKRAEIADGKPGGRITTTLFPNGSTPIIKPVGTTQVNEMVALAGRYESAASNLLNTRDSPQYCLNRDRTGGGYKLRRQGSDTPFFHHVASLVELYEAAQKDEIYTHHFNTLRSVLEKTAVFHGHGHFSACIKRDPNDADGILHQRFIDLLSHGKYSLYEPKEMGDETRDYFRTILYAFLKDYPFNPTLFPPLPVTAATPAAPPVKAPAKASKKTARKAPATPPTS